MILTINNKYRIKGDALQWTLEQRKRRVAQTAQDTPAAGAPGVYTQWQGIGYFVTLAGAVGHLTELQLRISGAQDVVEALVEAKRITAEIVAALTAEFELQQRAKVAEIK